MNSSLRMSATAGRRNQTFVLNESASSTPNQAINPAPGRNLRKGHLGGVIFGCKNTTIKECLFKQLFGLPAQHLSYVKNIEPGLPLFLFNYSDRKLHGIFEAASSGQMNINPYAWTSGGSERTQYPAQVQIRVRLQCQPLPEDQFKPIIVDNYFTQSHFWFELDHAQTSKLLSLLSSLAVAPSTFAPQNTEKWRSLFRTPISPGKGEESKCFTLPALEVDIANSSNSNGNMGSLNAALRSDGDNQPLEALLGLQVVGKNEKEIYMKLKELAANRECLDMPLCLTGSVDNAAVIDDGDLDSEGQAILDVKSEEGPVDSFDYPSIIAKLVQEVEELKAFRIEQIQNMTCLEQKLAEAEREIRHLKDQSIMLESTSNPSMEFVDEKLQESLDKCDLDLDELIFLVGGYNGTSWLSSLDCYSPSLDVIKSLKPMNYIRSYASAAKLNGELFVFGGGNGSLWYDTVESYDPANNQWSLFPSLSGKKGSLAGATLNSKIFAIGGGNGFECFADVEMFDTDIGRWIPTRSMLQKRFALAAAELNGAIYAVGGYDGKDYLKSAERFDPREHSWTRLESMNTKRGCHSLAVLNDKIYALGGFDGTAMVPSIEIFDPRLGYWISGEPMNQSRGYSAAAVFKDSIYVIGGVETGNAIVDTVERYEEGQGWQTTNLRAIGKRCFFSAVIL